MPRNAERDRLDEDRRGVAPWKRWGPYLSERQWGTVREDYSDDGNAWDYFPHDHARSRAYHWGEDGLAGLSDDRAVLCFALALWNGRDPILKERLFGLANGEGNHGEDVKELYFYLDATPTHSYLKYLYKYPQRAFPYEELVHVNRSRSRQEPEYEILDTGVFDDGRAFDVTVEYAKAGPEDLLIRISALNCGPEDAPLHILPHLWFRNTWSWMGGGPRPRLDASAPGARIVARHEDPRFRHLSGYELACDGDPELLFTENESNHARLFGGTNATPFVKDGINDRIVNGRKDAVNPESFGTKAAAHYAVTIPAGQSHVVRLRLSKESRGAAAFTGFDATFEARIGEADQFHRALIPPGIREGSDRARVMRQALAGMIWTKQFFYFDLDLWLDEHRAGPLAPQDRRSRVRNHDWFHMANEDVISMPDKWEYPWYAAWDLAFHAVPLGMVDSDFAKEQMLLMLDNRYQHPNGQVPAYEWNFGDVNPPVHASAAMHLYLDEAAREGKGDLDFLKRVFTRLLLNFTWWVNRKDRSGNNCFQGGFLGLDNIGIFDRSSPLPTGGHLDQSDGNAWMVFFSQAMLRMAVELAQHDRRYEEFATKFFGHTIAIGAAMDRANDSGASMWDEEDGFFYDVLRLPDGSSRRLKVRSMVGLLPLVGVAVFEGDVLEKLPDFRECAAEFGRRHPELCERVHLPSTPGVTGRRMLSIMDEGKLRRVLTRMFDEAEFLSPFGIRALSRHHRDHPFVLTHGGQEFRVSYSPGDSETGAFGGNSNWRGPVWMPVNFLIWAALIRLYTFFGDGFKIECPTGSGNEMNLFHAARELAARLARPFLADENGRRPCMGRFARFHEDPRWRDLLLFHEYFHGDDGSGLGACHQTGWTGVIATIIQADAMLDERQLLQRGGGGELRRALASPSGQ